MNYAMKCWKCGKVATEEPVYKCTHCGNIVQAQYNALPTGGFAPNDNPGLFRYAAALPECDERIVSLGEGNTPLVRSYKLAKALGMDELYFKMESANPSASFKDRAMAVGATCALRFGAKRMIVASSGNASSSAAAYAARCGLPIVALIPESTPAAKVLQTQFYGATVIKVPGNYSACYALCRQMAEQYGWFDMTTTYINPYAREGYKTMGYEVYEQLGRVPDCMVIPVGAGPLLGATYHAFKDLQQMGVIDKLPRLICAQASACAPVAKAFAAGESTQACADPTPTIASGISDALVGYADDGDYTIACVKESGGTAAMLSEEGILQATLEMAGEGFFAEPSGAVGYGVLKLLRAQGLIAPGESTVIAVTGHGLKSIPKADFPEPPVLTSSAELEAYITSVQAL